MPVTMMKASLQFPAVLGPDGYPPLAVTLKTPAPLAALAFADEYDRVSGDRRADLLAAYVLKHLAAWDVVDEGGQPAPVSADNLRRIPTAYLFAAEAELNTAAKGLPVTLKN